MNNGIITLHVSAKREDQFNTKYENEVQIRSAPSLEKALQYDNMTSKMRDNKRDTNNFIETDCIMIDIDNTHSNDPEEWLTSDAIEELLPVNYYIVQSRNYMKQKVNSKGVILEAREKWHIYLPLNETIKAITDYERIINNIICLCPYIDVGAIDSARFFYGIKQPKVKAVSNGVFIDDYIKELIKSNSFNSIKEERVNSFINKYTDKSDEDLKKWINKIKYAAGIQQQASISDINILTNNIDAEEVPDAVKYIEQYKRHEWLKKWAKDHNINLGKLYIYDKPDRKHVISICVKCPWCANHTTKDSETDSNIQIDADGKLNYICRHNHCIGKGWKAYRNYYDPEEQREKINNQICNETKQLTPEEELDAFIDLIQTNRYEPVPTGIHDIDQALKGGFIRQQEVFISAAPGMGKTVLCQQIAEQFARKNNEVVYYNLEMSKEQMIARSLSRRCDADLSALDILQGYKLTAEELEAVKDAKELYRYQVGNNLLYNPQYYNTETNKYENCNAVVDKIVLSMEQIAEKAKKEERRTPIYFIDYLHLLRTEEREDSAEMIKRAVQSFKDIAVKYNTIVFVISANNRTANKSGKASMDSGRDTSAIEYSGDILLSLNYKASDSVDSDLTAESITRNIQSCRDNGKEIPQEYKLDILRITKSRYTEPYKSVVLEFDGKHSRFNQVLLNSKQTRSNKSNTSASKLYAPNKNIKNARKNREKKREDYIKAINDLKESEGKVTVYALADYLGTSVKTVKGNLNDLLPGMVTFDGKEQTVKNQVIDLILDEEMQEADIPLAFETE